MAKPVAWRGDVSGQELRDIFRKVGYGVAFNRRWAWALTKPGCNSLLIMKVQRYDWRAIHHLRRAAGVAEEAFFNLID